MSRRDSYLKSLREQLTSVARDLSTMSAALAGSEWHLDRVDEARFLVAEIERVEAL